MEIKSTTTIKFSKEERSKLVDALDVLDDIYQKDRQELVQFDVSMFNLVDADDIAEMIRKLIIISDEGTELLKNIEI